MPANDLQSLGATLVPFVLHVIDETGRPVPDATVALAIIARDANVGMLLLKDLKSDAQGLVTTQIVRGIIDAHVEAAGYYTENFALGDHLDDATPRVDLVALRRLDEPPPPAPNP